MIRPGMKNGETRRGPRSRKQQRRFRDALDAADAGADQHAAGDLVVVVAGMPVGIVERLCRGAMRKDDKVVDLALLLGLHPLIGD